MKKFLTYLFIFGGSIYLIISFFLFKSDLRRKENAINITATIVEITRNKTDKVLTISYEVDGEKHLESFDYNYGDFIGKKLSLYCNKDNHQDVFGNKIYNMYLIAKYSGLFFLSIGLVMFSIITIEQNRLNKLKELGILIQAKFEKVVPIKILGKQLEYPFRIECSWFDPTKNQKIIIRSKIIWNEEKLENIKKNKIKEFPVYLDPTNYQRYFMDTSQIQKDCF